MLISTNATPTWFVNTRHALWIRLIGAFVFSPLLLLLFIYFISYPIQSIRKIIKRYDDKIYDKNLQSHRKFQFQEIVELNESFDWMFERVEQSLNNKQSLMELISHEIRSPLTRQKLALQMMDQTINDDKNLKIVVTENANTIKLVDKIFSYLSLNQSEVTLKLTQFNFNDVVEDVIDNCNFEFKTNVVKFNAENDYVINADITLISIAIQNIIKNALKYSGIKKPISVTLHSKNNNLILTCTDNGPGVSPDSIKAIFKPFFRGQLTKNTIKGYGLGLALTKKIVQLHKGSISAENLNKRGLKIIIVLPRAC